jgi:hypothetical protein
MTFMPDSFGAIGEDGTVCAMVKRCSKFGMPKRVAWQLESSRLQQHNLAQESHKIGIETLFRL